MAKTNFIDGDKATGIPGTKVMAAWLNKIFGSSGHVHDGLDDDGHAPKINLTNGAEVQGILPQSMGGASQWYKPSLTFTYVSTTSFKVNGDQTDIYKSVRRLKINLTGSTVYSEVVSATYSAPDTTVVILDAVLNNTLVDVEHSLFLPRKDNGAISAKMIIEDGGDLSTMPNLVNHGGFDSWIAGVSAVPEGWTATGTPTHEQVAKEIGFGAFYYKVTAGAAISGITQTLSGLKASTTYSFSCRVKVNAGNTASIVTTGATINLNLSSTSTSYQTKTGTFVTDGSGTDVVLKLLASANTDVAYFGAIIVQESSVNSQFIPSPVDFAFRNFQVFDSSSTFNTTGKSKIMIEVWGGGGGGAPNGISNGGIVTSAPTSGGTSQVLTHVSDPLGGAFTLISATGGTAPLTGIGSKEGGVGGTSSATENIKGENGGNNNPYTNYYPNSPKGGSSPRGGQGGQQSYMGGVGTNGQAPGGGGGGGGGSLGTENGAGGGGGGYGRQIFTNAINYTYGYNLTVTIGAGGAGGTGNITNGGAGAAGRVVIWW